MKINIIFGRRAKWYLHFHATGILMAKNGAIYGVSVTAGSAGRKGCRRDIAEMSIGGEFKDAP